MSIQNPVFIPGPTNMPEAIRQACFMPTIDHRSPVFGKILHPVLEGVQRVLKSETAKVFIFPSTGTGGWETALSNCLNAGDKVLAARNGMFSHRWIDMCQRHGLDVQVVETAWGNGLPAEEYEAILKADTNHSIKVVLATHNETATLPRTFFDVKDMQAGYDNNAFPYTPPVGLMRGLKLSLEMLEEEGLENVFARHTRIATGVRHAVKAWGLELCATSPDVYSDTVSAIKTPEGFNATDIVTVAAERYGMAFGVGLGEVAGKVFRIGHLGSLTDAMMLSGLATAEMVMADLGLDVKLGSGVAAAQEFYRHGS